MGTTDRREATARERIEALAADAFGAGVLRVEPIEAGLGARRFFRVHLANAVRSCPPVVVARVDFPEDPALRPAGLPPEPPLEPLLHFLEEGGLPVPACHAVAEDILFLEDVGDESLEGVARSGGRETAELYREACGWLPRLQSLAARPSEVAAFGRHLSRELFAYKADQFNTFALPWATRARGRVPRAAELRLVRDAFDWIATECTTAPKRLAHRDYKAANLHVRRSAPAGRRLVMIDLQGAFLAPPEYDLVCLLRDSHVALPESLVQDLLTDTRPRLPDAPDPETFDRRFTLLTLTRNGKDLSRYLYAMQSGDERYVPLLDRAVQTLRAAAGRAREWDPILGRLHELIALLPESACAR